MTALAHLLTSIDVGEPISCGFLQLYPLCAPDDLSINLRTLDEALSAPGFSIAEASTDGFVPELTVTNQTDLAVFLMDGEQVLGLKQNRTFNLSLVVPAKSEAVIPVSCLERGRWATRAAEPRASAHAHFASGRASKLRSVSENLMTQASYRSDQSRVWRDIDAKLSDNFVASETSAEADLFEVRRDRLNSDVASVQALPGQVGVVSVAGGKLVGFDLFGSTKLYSRLSAKVLASYLLDAKSVGPDRPGPEPSAVRQRIFELLCNPAARFDAPAAGETTRWKSNAGDAAALTLDDQLVHAVGFFAS